MKYCKKCGCLYVTDVCPKCGIEEPENQPEPEAPDKKTLVHQWIGLLVGIPLFIMAIYVVIHNKQLLHTGGYTTHVSRNYHRRTRHHLSFAAL